MHQIFLALKRAFGKSLFIVGMLSLIILSSLFIFVQPPSLASPISTEGRKLIQQEKMDKESQETDERSQAYEQQVKAAQDPDKVYEENLKAYQKEHPEDLVTKTVQGAEKLVDKVTGKE